MGCDEEFIKEAYDFLNSEYDFEGEYTIEDVGDDFSYDMMVIFNNPGWSIDNQLRILKELYLHMRNFSEEKGFGFLMDKIYLYIR